MRIESSLYERLPLSYDSITSTTYFTISSDEPSRATMSSLGKRRRAFGFPANAKHGIPSKDASAMICPALSDGSNATIHLARCRFLKYSAYENSPHDSFQFFVSFKRQFFNYGARVRASLLHKEKRRARILHHVVLSITVVECVKYKTVI